MARRRKQSLLERLSSISIVSILINPVTMMILVSVFASVLWNKYHTRLDLQVNRTITRDLLHLNQPPKWIKTDISKIAIQESRLSEISLGEPRAVEMVASSLAVQPWVKSVQRVRKTSSGIHVDLQYRRPMAFIEVGKQELLPVDDEGVVLDGRDFATSDIANYWRVYLSKPLIHGLATGRVWDDIRVTDSVLIANAWNGEHADAGLMHIVNRSQPTRDRIRLGDYELWTRAHKIIIWGNPPGYEIAGEASAARKIQAIREFIKLNGPLDTQQDKVFDVRSGQFVVSAAKLASDYLDFLNLKY